MVIGIICGLWAVTLVGAGFLIYRMNERCHALVSEMADRIVAPDAARIAAFEAAIPRAPVIDTDDEDDRKYGFDLPAEPDLIPFEAIGRPS